MVFRNIHFNKCTRKFQYWESIDILWKPGSFIRTHLDRLYSNNLKQSKIKGFQVPLVVKNQSANSVDIKG